MENKITQNQCLYSIFEWLTQIDIGFNDLILAALGLSSVLSILAWTGFLPQSISKRINLRKSEETLMVLSKLGINPDKYAKGNIAKSIPNYIDSNNIQNTLSKILKECTIQQDVGVGRTEQVKTDKYIDVMSMSTNPADAVQLARCLSSFWRKLLNDNKAEIKNPEFTFIVNPKGGSPILGYEFAKIMQKPFALHISGNHKFTSADEKLKFKSCFDSKFEPKEGDIALIVDDSATGGRKVLEAISDLKSNGIVVTDCLVLFEPTVKNIREKLNSEGIQLHSILEI